VTLPAVPFGAMSVSYTAAGVVLSYVPADFNGDGFVDAFDYDDFIRCFEGEGCPVGRTADFNNNGIVDGFDYGDFVVAFESGC